MDQFQEIYSGLVNPITGEVRCSVCTRCGCLIAEEFKDRHRILCK